LEIDRELPKLSKKWFASSSSSSLKWRCLLHGVHSATKQRRNNPQPDTRVIRSRTGGENSKQNRNYNQ